MIAPPSATPGEALVWIDGVAVLTSTDVPATLQALVAAALLASPP